MLGDSDLDEEAEVLYGLYENLVLNHLMDPVLDDLEKKTRANGIVIVTIPNHSLLLTNREVIKIILQMETTMIHDVEKKLLDDLKAIRPFINESPVQKEIKLAAVKRDEKYVRDVTAAAIQEANAGTTWKPTEPTVQTSNDSQSSSDSGSGSDSASGSDRSISYQREPTEALRQLMHVNVKGWGSN
jgi:hypothetical protein